MTRSWTKRIALLLLLWTVLDLTVPGMCGSDGVTLPACADGSTLLQANHSKSAHTQVPEDDCFCCCSHVAPQRNFILFVSLPDAFGVCCLSTSFPHEMATEVYRPPRNS